MRLLYRPLSYQRFACVVLFTIILLWSIFPVAKGNLLRWPRGLPLPTSSHWVLESVDVVQAAGGTHYAMALVNLSGQEAARYIAQLEEQGYRPSSGLRERTTQEGTASLRHWCGKKGTDRLELYHRGTALLVFWSRPAPNSVQ